MISWRYKNINDILIGLPVDIVPKRDRQAYAHHQSVTNRQIHEENIRQRSHVPMLHDDDNHEQITHDTDDKDDAVDDDEKDDERFISSEKVGVSVKIEILRGVKVIHVKIVEVVFVKFKMFETELRM